MKNLFTTIYLIAILFSVSSFAQNKEIWGLSGHGGLYNGGCIFKTDSLGNNHTVVYNFENYIGDIPCGKLCKANNGKLYGLTVQRGNSTQNGVLYEYDYINNNYKKIIEFDSLARFAVEILNASNGKIYGITSHSIFEYDYVNNIFSTKFQSNTNEFRSIIEADNGKLYGLCSIGYTGSHASLFEYDYNTNTYSTKSDLDSLDSGYIDPGNLLQASNGKIYGATTLGGSKNFGFLFEYNIQSNNLVKLYDFNPSQNPDLSSSSDGISEFNGKLYWTTSHSFGYGALSEFDLSSNSLSVKHIFNSSGGFAPRGKLLLASNNKFYGLTSNGGRYYYGIVYEYDPVTGNYSQINDLADNINSQFHNPIGSFIELSNGLLICASSTFDPDPQHIKALTNGVIFEFDINNKQYDDKLIFGGAKNGNLPSSKLHQATNGKLYGTTIGGGKYNYGTIFEFDPSNNTYTKKFDVNPYKMGYYSLANLFPSKNGSLYGTAQINDSAFIYEFNPSSDSLKILLKLKSGVYFGVDNNFIMEKDGAIYGYSSAVDSSNGIIYKYDILNNTFNKLYTFSSANNYSPKMIIQADSANFYGITYLGGNSNKGTIFQYNFKTNLFTRKFNFGFQNATYPITIIFDSLTNKLFGTALANNNLTEISLFEYDLSLNKFNILYTDYNNFTSSIVKVNKNIFGVNFNNYGSSQIPYSNFTATFFSFNTLSSVAFNPLFDYSVFDYNLANNSVFGNINELSVFKTCANNSVFIENKTISASDSTATTYQWINCNNNTDIVGANSYTYSPSAPGYYAVKISKNGCTTISTCIAYEITGIKEIENNANFQVFPNPNNGSFTIKTSFYKSLQIINMIGQLVKQVDLKENSETEINGLAPGMYFIKTENGTVLNKKIVVVN